MSEKTPKIFLRPFTENDLPAMVCWNNDPEIEYLVDRCLPKTLGRCLAWFRRHSGERNYRLYALENEEGRLIGKQNGPYLLAKKGSGPGSGLVRRNTGIEVTGPLLSGKS